MADAAGDDRHEQVEAARSRAELSVPELWLRYVALGGNGDLFDIDGYLNGLLSLTVFDQDVLAVAVNERLEELYRTARVRLSAPPPTPAPSADLHDVITALLDRPGSPRPASPPSSANPRSADDTHR